MVAISLGAGILGAAVVGGGAALLAGGAQASAAGEAGRLQSEATRASIAELRRQFDLSRSDLAPYRETGVPALAQYAALSGIRRVRQGGSPASGGSAAPLASRSLLEFFSRGHGGRGGGVDGGGDSGDGGGAEGVWDSGPAGPLGRALHTALSLGMGFAGLPALAIPALIGRAVSAFGGGDDGIGDPGAYDPGAPGGGGFGGPDDEGIGDDGTLGGSAGDFEGVDFGGDDDDDDDDFDSGLGGSAGDFG